LIDWSVGVVMLGLVPKVWLMWGLGARFDHAVTTA